MSRLYALPLALVLVLMLAATATAKTIAFDFKEGPGDGLSPALDIQKAAVAYDPKTGALAASLTLGAPPVYTGVSNVDLELGRYSEFDGSCDTGYTLSTTMPDPQDVEAGMTTPYTELFFRNSIKSLAFIPSVTAGNTITINGAVSDPDVLARLAPKKKDRKFTCVFGSSWQPETFDVGDKTEEHSLLQGRKPKCRILRRKIQGGSRWPIRCKGAPQRVAVSISSKKDTFNGHENVKRGRFSVPSTRSMRGRWNVIIWKGDFVIARFLNLRVR